VTLDVRLWLAVLFALAAFALLGYRVARGPLRWPDAATSRFFGHGVPVARIFTISGYARVLSVLGALAVVAALAARAQLKAVVMILFVQIASQVVIEAIKATFGRARPAEWHYRQERGYSYPSGHAATAVVFYGMWAWLVASSALPAAPKAVLAVLLLGWALGICWSRLALGAHYVTDVLGGMLFGAAFVCAELTALSALGLAA